MGAPRKVSQNKENYDCSFAQNEIIHEEILVHVAEVVPNLAARWS